MCCPSLVPTENGSAGYEKEMAKSKKDKKSHKSHKSSKRDHAQSSSSSKSHRASIPEDEPLAVLLNNAILKFPKLLEELPSMISTLDAGQFISIESISDLEQRNLLTEIALKLPLHYDKEDRLWFKNDKDISISGYILNFLLDDGCIKQPTELSISESIACQHGHWRTLMTLLSSYPELRTEFPQLLSVLRDGNCIDVDNIENETIREGLEKVFRSLELINTDEG